MNLQKMWNSLNEEDKACVRILVKRGYRGVRDAINWTLR